MSDAPTIERDWTEEWCGQRENIGGVIYIVTWLDRSSKRVRLQPLYCWHERERARGMARVGA